MDPVGVQYGDFVLSDGSRVEDERWEPQLAYWRKQLSGLEPLEQATDHPRPSVQRFRGGIQHLSLTKQIFEGLKKLRIEKNATLFMVFLAVFKALLLRYSSQENIGSA
jgi:Condensation domain